MEKSSMNMGHMCRQIPLLGEFKHELNTDNTLRSHFNTFLKLPVFPQRFHYVAEKSKFELCPKLQTPYLGVDDHRVLQWVYYNRLPYFWNSDLFFAFRLSQELSRNVNMIFSTCSGLQSFMKFLSGSAGESACLFWMIVEKLKAESREEHQYFTIERIHQLHLCATAPFQLPSEMLEDILKHIHGSLTLTEEIANLVQVQGKIMANIENYWCKKFVNDCSHLLLGESASDYGEIDHAPISPLPSFITDRGEEGFMKRANVLPSLCPKPLLTDEKIAPSPPITQLLISPSTERMLSSSVDFHLTVDPQQNRSERNRFMPFLQGTLRSNYSSGAPLNHFINSDFYYKNAALATSNVQFWVSVENLLTKDELRRWHNRRCQRNECSAYAALFHGFPLSNTIESLLDDYLSEVAQFPVQLPAKLREQLLILLPKGLGQGLLLDAQEHVCKQLYSTWEDYIVADHNSFIRFCTDQKTFPRLPIDVQQKVMEEVNETHCADKLIQTSYCCSSVQTHLIWGAIEFIETITNPGLNQLPSRSFSCAQHSYSRPSSQVSISMDRTAASTPDDWKNIEYKGVSLNPMMTTIVVTSQWTTEKWIKHTYCFNYPASNYGKDMSLMKPSAPEDFNSLLKNPGNVRCFYQFLASKCNGAEVPLVFWLAVEDLKDSMNEDEVKIAAKVRRIKRRFFTDGYTEIALHCKDYAVRQLSAAIDPTPFQFFDAQEAVTAYLHSHWFEEYQLFLKGDPDSADQENEEDKEEDQKPLVREHTRGLWSMFTRNVTSFKRGLMDPPTFEQFKIFLRKEVLRGNTSGNKKVIGKKITINVSKLLNDLCFWAEVERYKDMADVVNIAKANGTFTPEDNMMVHKKANAIVNCYIDSPVSPRTQINIPSQIATQILDNLSLGLIARGLFHEAALNIFSVLIFYWKRFCMWRWAPPKDSSSGDKVHSSFSQSSSDSAQEVTPTQYSDGSTLSYSVKRGLRLIRQLQIDSKTTQSGLSVRRTNVPSQFIVRKADLSSTTAQSKLSKVKTAQTNLSKVQMAQPMTKSTQ